jgi:hypothetical protein
MQIAHDGFADIDRQRQPFGAAALAPHDYLPLAPVNVIEFERGDLPGAQAEAGQHGQDREVTPSGRGAPVAAGEQASHRSSVQHPGQRPGAMGRVRDRSG